MLIIGCDFHTRYQQIAMADDETGELLVERRLEHESGQALAFYRRVAHVWNRWKSPGWPTLCGFQRVGRSSLLGRASTLFCPWQGGSGSM